MKKLQLTALFLIFVLMFGLLAGCSNKNGQTNDGEEDVGDRFNGTWLELNAIGRVWIISGDSLEIYTHDDEGQYVPESVPEGFTVETTYKNGVIRESSAGEVDGKKVSETREIVLSLEDGMLVTEEKITTTMGLIKDTENYSRKFARIDTPLSELRRINLEQDKAWREGNWVTEDEQYSFYFYSKEDFVSMYSFSDVEKDGLYHRANSFCYVYSNGCIVWNIDVDKNTSGFVLLRYTLEGDRLTISGLDKVVVQAIRHREGELFADVTYEYSAVSELTFIYEKENGNGENERDVLCEYDDEGRLIKKTVYAREGVIEYIEEYDEEAVCRKISYYDEDGTLAQVKEYDENGTCCKGTYYYYDEGNLYLTQVKEEYDEYGNVVWETNYYEDDTIRVFYEYDENGTLSRLTVYLEDGTAAQISEFDENGTTRKVTIYEEGGSSYVEEYDENEVLRKVTYYTKDGTVRLVQEFDENGNPIP